MGANLNMKLIAMLVEVALVFYPEVDYFGQEMDNEDVAGVCVDIAISQGPAERKRRVVVANTDQVLLAWSEDDAELG